MAENTIQNNELKMEKDKTSTESSSKQQLTYRYKREEMMTIRESEISRTRPTNLSKEFDNEDGFFSPDKWLQYRWQCEGVENRVKRRPTVAGSSANIGGSSSARTLGSIVEGSTNDLDQQTVLSPQRRGFSSGCRAPSPANEDDKQTTKSRWRQGQLNNGTDFKPAFQKSALEATSRSSRSGSSHNTTSSCGGSWAVVGSSKFWEKGRRVTDRERTRSTNTENEQMPEWMEEGPASAFDVVELKGFDDDPRTDKRVRRRSKCKEIAKAAKNSDNRESPPMANKATGGSSRPVNRQKRHSGGDTSQTQNNTSRPCSRQTPNSVRSIGDLNKNSSASPVQIIQVSELESSFLKEQLNAKGKGTDDAETFNLYAALGMSPSQWKSANKNEENLTAKLTANKLPNSDAEFAAFILGLPKEQISKTGEDGLSNLENTIKVQSQPPATSRLSRFFAKNANANTPDSQTSNISSLTAKETDSAQNQTKSPFNLSTLQANLEQSRRSSSAGQHFQRPLSAELIASRLSASPSSQTPVSRLTPQQSTMGMGIGAVPGFNAYNQFQRILVQTARAMQPNPNVSPDVLTMNAAFNKLMQDPMMRAMALSGGGGTPHNATPTPHHPFLGVPSMSSSHPTYQPHQQPQFFGPPVAVGNFHHSSGPTGMPPHHQQQQNFFGGPHHLGPIPHQQHNFFGPPHHLAGPLNHHPAGFAPPHHAVFNPNFQPQQHQQMAYPPSLVNPPPKSNHLGQSPNLLNSPAFMPTSVMRQMSKVPTASGSIPYANDTSGAPPPLLQKLFADANKIGNLAGQPCRPILGRSQTQSYGN